MSPQPCDWPVEGCGSCAAYASLDPELQAQVDEMAINYLWSWTNRRFSSCPVSYRPCRKRCAGWGGGVQPWLINGRVFNLCCGLCGETDTCSCAHVSQIILPGPIAEPIEILIDGIELPLDAVRIDNYSIIVRIDGGHFPECQDLGLDPSEPGTWQVTYLQGEALPAGAGLVTGMLACEFAKSICGDASCRLPQRVTSISRQGVTLAMLDDFKGLDSGYTGIWSIDQWISAANRPQRPSRIYSPDVPVPRQTTWSYGAS